MRIKKDCSGCIALGNNECILGYKTEQGLYIETFGVSLIKPSEICEKPLTYKKFHELLENQRHKP